ncbi:hypothetical protein [Poseidonocella sp. HB161398]|uniref:hypothetical protein n=1 Tax=Poseidonocella sp. HB161398 TaxID=2320855 RepID=UPI0011084CC8|nr:hypothetical protein [Poseidonocella sp. HB161398]
MSLIRPEIRAGLWRGRELVAAAGLVLLGLWIALATFGVTRWLGWAVLLAGVALGIAGWQRMRLRPKEQGLGMIEADEGRITYWGPLDGGSVERDLLSAVAIDHRSHPPVWVLSQPGAPDLHIPVTAGGQDALIDTLNSLPGLTEARLVAARNRRGEGRYRLWSVSGAVDTGAASQQVSRT